MYYGKSYGTSTMNYYTDQVNKDCNNCEYRLEWLNGDCYQTYTHELIYYLFPKHEATDTSKPICMVPSYRGDHVLKYIL